MMRDNDLKPWQHQSWKCSKDPDFDFLSARASGLLLMPPKDSAVLSLDEKPGILLRSPVGDCRPPAPGRGVLYPFEYERHGTLCMHAALDVHTGEVIQDTTQRNRASEYIDLLELAFIKYGTDRDVHILRDRSRCHSTPAVMDWFTKHPNFIDIPLPKGASWLNPVERFFSIFQRQCLDHVHFPLPAGLKGKDKRGHWLRERFLSHINSYVETYNQQALPFQFGSKVRTLAVHGMLGACRRAATGYRYLRGTPAVFRAGRRGETCVILNKHF